MTAATPSRTAPARREGTRTVVFRVPLPGRGGISGRVPLRSVVACAALVLATLAVGFWALMQGERIYAPAEVFHALFADAPRLNELYVVSWNLPRAVSAIVLGAMLGVAGAIFQSITRNALGSPDIIGFTAGASAGGVAVTAFVGSGYYLVAGGALAGGAVVAVLMVLLSRGAGIAGFRLVIVGIALSAMLMSLERWFVLTADLDLAQVASLWSTGSLNGATFAYSGPALLAGTAVMIAAVVLLGRRLDLLEHGDDLATALGIHPDRTRLWGIAAGVVLIAAAISVAGPIAFVALAAPHIGRRLAGSAGAALAPAACAGAFVLSSADLIAQHAIPGQTYPVGLVTVAVGGVYLLTLLIRENRRGVL